MLKSDMEWEEFGMRLLQVTNNVDIAPIEGNSLLEKCKRLLNLWKLRNSKPEWEQVLAALKEIGLNNLATELKDAIVIQQPKAGGHTHHDQAGGHTHHDQAGKQVAKP